MRTRPLLPAEYDPSRKPEAWWLTLVVALPPSNPEARMRVLRTLEGLGAGVVREGVYVLPDAEPHRASLEKLVSYVRSIEGTAHMMASAALGEAEERALRSIVDRGERYSDLMKTLEAVESAIGLSEPSAIARVLKRQREEFASIEAVDFLGSPLAHEAAVRLAILERRIGEKLFPARSRKPRRSRTRADYFGKRWVTRRPADIDRLASAWLIRRFIDAEACLEWLGKSAAVPDEAILFGCKDASFAASKDRITFEELAHFFRLDDDPALARLGRRIRAIHAGERSQTEADAIESMLDGARRRAKSDETLLEEVEHLLDLLYERSFTPQRRRGLKNFLGLD